MNHDDEEKLLIQRESLKYDDKVKKSLLRETLHRIKINGYNSISHKDSILIKVFIGYISELENINEILECLIECLKKENYREKIVNILKNKIKNDLIEELK